MNQLSGTGWPAIVCLGEVLTDFVALDSTLPLPRATNFHRAAGGAPANVAVALARLGIGVAFIGKVGGDTFGQVLRATLAAEAVDSLGAGDAFVAGLLAGLSAQPDRSRVGDEALLVPALRFANAVGAITTTRYGAIPALPTRAQVETLLGV